MSFVVKRLILIIFILLVIIIVFLTSLTVLYKQKVADAIQEVLAENLSTKFSIEKIKFNYYTRPGQLTLILNDVKVFDHSSTILAQINQAQFTCELPAILQGKYTIKKIFIKDVKLNLRIDKNGQSNYEDIFTFESHKKSGKLKFSPHQITFENLNYQFENQYNQFAYHFNLPKCILRVNKLSNPVHVELMAGDILDFKMTHREKLIHQEPKSNLSGIFTFDKQTAQASFESLKLKVKKSRFLMNGYYQFLLGDDKVNIQLSSEQKDLSPLIAFLPQSYYDKLSNFKTEGGNIRFNGQIKGDWSALKQPTITINFGANKISLRSSHNIRQVMEDVSFEGTFSNGRQKNWSSSMLHLDSIQASLAGRKLRASLKIQNITKPFLEGNLETGVDLTAFNEFYPLDGVEEIQGILGIKLNYKGALETSNNQNDSSRIQGKIDFVNIHLLPTGSPMQFKDIHAKLELRNQALILKSLQGKVGETDFSMHGQVNNFMSYLIHPLSKFNFEGNLESLNLRLEDFLSLPSAPDGEPDFNKTPYFLQLPKWLAFKLNCKVQKLKFRKFSTNMVSGEVQLKDRMLKTGNLQGNFAKGKLNLVAILNAQKPDYIHFDGRLQLKKTDSRKVFIQFEDFSQHYVKSMNLNGMMDADIKYAMVFNRNLWVKYPNLVADIHATIEDGTLNQLDVFKKIGQKLGSKLFDDLGFSSLKSIIQIRNKTIYFPEIAIQNPHLDFQLIGQTLPQESLDYAVKLMSQKIASSSALQDQQDSPIFFINLKGTTDSYTVIHKPQDENSNIIWQKQKLDYLKLFNENSLTEEDMIIEDSLEVFPKRNKISLKVVSDP